VHVKEVRGLTVRAVVVVSASVGGGGEVVVDARGWLQADVTLLCLCAAGRHQCHQCSMATVAVRGRRRRGCC